MKRREFIKHSTQTAAGIMAMPLWSNVFKDKDTYPAIRAITKGPKFHWFGYYDKWQFDPSGRYVLGMEVDFEGRSPSPTDAVKIGMVDLYNKDQWIELGESRAWGWQQGCMLQWVPGLPTKIIWNDRQGEQFVSHILDIRTRTKTTLPKAIYALSPDGKWAIGTEFSRINNLRPGYGYASTDPFASVKAPDEIGLYKMDLRTGHHQMLFSLADIAKIPHQGKSVENNFHWFNHLLVNTDGTRFTFLHRWRDKLEDRQTMATKPFVTRMFTADSNGKDLYLLDPSGHTSHFIWRDPSHICAWTKPEGQKEAFYVLEDKTGRVEPIGPDQMTVNGHNTYLPHTNNEWILNDTYPQGQERLQIPYLYHVPTDRKIILGKFPVPAGYQGEFRCDLHPRYSPDGKSIVIDSAHEGKGRQMYLIDIRSIVQA